MTPPPETIRAVAAAISRAEIHDDRMTSDPNRIRAWADTCTPHGINDTAIACHAVDHHYTRPGVDTIRVGDFIAAYRKLRRDQAEADKGTQTAGPDRQLDGLPIAGADGNPVWSAYEVDDAILLTCRSCGAEPEHACHNTITGGPRKVPCFTRLADAKARTR